MPAFWSVDRDNCQVDAEGRAVEVVVHYVDDEGTSPPGAPTYGWRPSEDHPIRNFPFENLQDQQIIGWTTAQMGGPMVSYFARLAFNIRRAWEEYDLTKENDCPPMLDLFEDAEGKPWPFGDGNNPRGNPQ